MFLPGARVSLWLEDFLLLMLFFLLARAKLDEGDDEGFCAMFLQ